VNNAQLQALWTGEGGDPSVADTMAAIALAESSGNPTDVNSSSSEGSSGSWGLWQINGDAHPQYDHQSLLNPKYNADAAIAVYGSQGLGAWSTYTHDVNGNAVTPGSSRAAYYSHLSGSSSPPNSTAPAPGTSPLSQFVYVAQTSENPITLANAWITNPSVNVLYKTFALCGVLILLGASKQTSPYAGWASLCILCVLLIQQQKATA
jgi:hypothetical protein